MRSVARGFNLVEFGQRDADRLVTDHMTSAFQRLQNSICTQTIGIAHCRDVAVHFFNQFGEALVRDLKVVTR